MTKERLTRTRYFYCCRSPHYRDSTSTGKRKRISGKIESFCTATITSCENLSSGEVRMEACLNHYGHELDRTHLSKLRLPNLEREKLVGKIKLWFLYCCSCSYRLWFLYCKRRSREWDVLLICYLLQYSNTFWYKQWKRGKGL